MSETQGASAWAEVRNLLCVRLDSIGDVIMTAPAMEALKCARPGRRITILTSPAGAQAARLLPEIDDIIVYEAAWVKATSGVPPRDHSQRIIEQLRAEAFDGAVIFTVYSQNPLPAAMLCYLSDVPLRLAYCHENPYHLLTDWVPDPEPTAIVRHEVQRQLDLVASIGCDTANSRITLRIPERAERRVSALLDDFGIDCGQPWVVIHPGASAGSRRYPPDAYARVADLLARNYGWQVLLTGSQGEAPIIESVQSRMRERSFSLAGRLNLGELAALIREAPVLISNNTAPVHLASALGTPVVCLYALTNPQHTPWGEARRVLYNDVPCRFCYKSDCPEGHHNCLRLVSPESVASAAVELQARTRGPAAGRTTSFGSAENSSRMTPVVVEVEAGGL